MVMITMMIIMMMIMMIMMIMMTITWQMWWEAEHGEAPRGQARLCSGTGTLSALFAHPDHDHDHDGDGDDDDDDDNGRNDYGVVVLVHCSRYSLTLIMMIVMMIKIQR